RPGPLLYRRARRALPAAGRHHGPARLRRQHLLRRLPKDVHRGGRAGGQALAQGVLPDGMPSISPEDVLSFWLGPDRADHEQVAARAPTWFAVDPVFDAAIRDRFAAAVDEASAGDLSSWEETPEGRLALILLLDQMRRNLFRDTAEMVTHDAEALRLALEGFEAGHYQRLHLFEKVFFLMPFQHAEDPAVQADSVERFAALA